MKTIAMPSTKFSTRNARMRKMSPDERRCGPRSYGEGDEDQQTGGDLDPIPGFRHPQIDDC